MTVVSQLSISFTVLEKRLAPVFNDASTQNRKYLQRSSKQLVHLGPSGHKCYTYFKASSSNASTRQFVSKLYSVTTIEAVDIVAGYIQRTTA